MKKLIVMLVCMVLSVAAYAQKDTTLIHKNVVFDTEVTQSKTGNEKINYIAKIDGVWYLSDKTSYTRYQTAKRFKANPNIAIVEDKKTKSIKVIVL